MAEFNRFTCLLTYICLDTQGGHYPDFIRAHLNKRAYLECCCCGGGRLLGRQAVAVEFRQRHGSCGEMSAAATSSTLLATHY